VARYKFDHVTGKTLVWSEKSKKWVKERKSAGKGFDFSKGFTVLPDIKEFVSPIDGSLISSRSKLRHHNRGHNVRQAGDFKPGEIIARENKRIEETRRIAAQGATTKWY
jgi:hypothetical protein